MCRNCECTSPLAGNLPFFVIGLRMMHKSEKLRESASGISVIELLKRRGCAASRTTRIEREMSPRGFVGDELAEPENFNLGEDRTLVVDPLRVVVRFRSLLLGDDRSGYTSR